MMLRDDPVDKKASRSIFEHALWRFEQIGDKEGVEKVRREMRKGLS
jgi:hypothetical protein